MNSKINNKIENLLNIQATEGSEALIKYGVSYLKNLLKEFPHKPDFDNEKAKEEYQFLYSVVYDENVMIKLGQKWTLDDYTSYCLIEIIKDIIDYLNPNYFISMSSNSLNSLIKTFEEYKDYEPHYFHEIYELQNNKRVLVDDKYEGIVSYSGPNHKKCSLPGRVHCDINQKVKLTDEISDFFKEWKAKGVEIVNPNALIK